MPESLPTGAVQAELRLASLDDYVLAVHGEPRALTVDEVAVLSSWGAGIVAYIQQRWPIDTGTSRDRWTYEVNPSPGEMAIFIENEMFYAEFVHRKGDSSKTPLWDRLVGDAWSLARERLLIEAKAAVDETEARIERLNARLGNEDEALREAFAFLRRGRAARHRIAPPPTPAELQP